MATSLHKFAALLAIAVYGTTTLLGHALHNHGPCDDLHCCHADHDCGHHHDGDDDDDDVAVEGSGEPHADHDVAGWHDAHHAAQHDHAGCLICQHQAQGQLAEVPTPLCMARAFSGFSFVWPEGQPRLMLVRVFDSRGPPLSSGNSSLDS